MISTGPRSLREPARTGVATPAMTNRSNTYLAEARAHPTCKKKSGQVHLGFDLSENDRRIVLTGDEPIDPTGQADNYLTVRKFHHIPVSGL